MIRDIAIDLGTANTLVYARGEGIIYNQPSVIAFNTDSGNVMAIGNDAWNMIGRTASHIQAHRPLRHGAITDFNITQQMIQLMLRQLGVNRFNRPRALICIPSALSPVERQAVVEAAYQAGVSATRLIEQPLAAAIGTDLPINQPRGNMIVDIGGGTSEAALVSMGKIMHSKAVRIGSFDLDNDIQTYVLNVRNFAIGERTAEDIKIIGGSAAPLENEPAVEVRGRECDTGMPRTFMLQPWEIRKAIEHSLSDIVTAIFDCLATIQEEFAEDLVESGLHLAGGGSMLSGLAERIEEVTKIKVHHVDKPLECVVRGAGQFIETSNPKELFSKSAV